MNRNRLPSPAEECLERAYPSSQKGGTLIVEGIADLATHEEMLEDPDRYRPPKCLACHHDRLHVHDYPSRVLWNEAEKTVGLIRYRCAFQECGATWRIVPEFLARQLWHRWAVVEEYVQEIRCARLLARAPSKQTVRRWRRRFRASARLLVGLLARSGEAVLAGLARAVGRKASRQELVWAHAAATGTEPGLRLANVAALAHRLLSGIRLM